MLRTALRDKIAIKMDEYTPDGVSLPFEQYIDPVIDEVTRELLNNAPLALLIPTVIPVTAGTIPDAGIVIHLNDKAYIPVPADYLRLYEIKYPLWRKSVHRAITPEEPAYKIQENEFIKSGYGRPVVAVVTTSVNGGSAKKYFECAKVLDPGVAPLTPVALYIKDESSPDPLNDKFYDSASWLGASKLMGIMGYPDKAKLCMEQYVNSMSSLVK